MQEEIVSGSQTETSQEIERDADTEALYDSFGMRPPGEKKEVTFPTMEEPQEEQEENGEPNDPPATEETKTESKKITVKHNKQDVEIDEDKVPELLQKGLALDKVREQAKQREADLDRAARLLGYKDHAELTANFDRIEQERVQKQADEFEAIKQQVIDQLVDAGVDEQQAKAFAENNPLVQKAKAAMQESEQRTNQTKAEREAAERQSKWDKLFETYPDLVASSKDDGTADWLTPDMDRMIKQGYDPIDAYRLAHADTIQAQSRKAAEQKAIKQVQLGQRAHVDAPAAPSDEVSLLPAQMALAEEFGVSVKGVQRQQQLLKNRR